MRDNRNKWQFFAHPSKPALSGREVHYWKEILKRLIKIGIEFEFNLPSTKGSCKGDNNNCPCTNIEDDCWRDCVSLSVCQKEPHLETCVNRLDSCKYTDCAKCSNFSHKCIGVTCINFVSQCFSCDDFIRNCDTCPQKYDVTKDPEHIRFELRNIFMPSGTYGTVSESGVVGVTTDGSLAGGHGVEIITIGRRIDFWEFYKMSKNIIDAVVEKGGFLNERTSSHMHLLASYYDSDEERRNAALGADRQGSPKGVNIRELEKDIPEIILANFHQLCRRYQNALTWMTIALGDPNHMTRWEKYRVSILDISPVTNNMNGVSRAVAQKAGGKKYGFVNYNNCRFNNDGDVSRFHIEMRQADSSLCPTWYAAITCLHYALVIKAVDISRYGLLKVGDEQWMKETKKMKNVILNNCPDNYDGPRVSDTSNLLDHVDYFRRESLDLIGQLKGVLLRMGPAYDVLVKIAEKPIALRLIEGNTYTDIEKDIEVKLSDVGQLQAKIEEVIDLKLVDDCQNITEWVTQVAKCLIEENELDQTPTDKSISNIIDMKMKEGEIIWSNSFGCFVSI